MNYGGLFDPDTKNEKIKNLEQKTMMPNFWDADNSASIITELNELRSSLDEVFTIKKKVDDNLALIQLLKSEYDEEIKVMLENEINELEILISNQELKLLLDEPYDYCDSILEIHPGAGGTESCDWAGMLYRMYLRYCEKQNYKMEVIDYQEAEEAGLKSVTIIIHGKNSYGYLKGEKGVHRLIRISPFDSNSRRHTSFASVEITPFYQNDNDEIEIKDTEIRIDVYRSSGKGGQGVNTTDSAVRITHLATNIVVTCQNERSQIRNKEIALTVLKNKLYKLKLEEQEKQLSSIKGESSDINFGSQIRTYTMHPYSLVKDHRTNTETGSVGRVLDGDIGLFINEYLRRKK